MIVKLEFNDNYKKLLRVQPGDDDYKIVKGVTYKNKNHFTGLKRIILDNIENKWNLLNDSTFTLTAKKSFSSGKNFAKLQLKLFLSQELAEFKGGVLKKPKCHYITSFEMVAEIRDDEVLNDCNIIDDYKHLELTLIDTLKPHIYELCHKIKLDLNLEV